MNIVIGNDEHDWSITKTADKQVEDVCICDHTLFGGQGLVMRLNNMNDGRWVSSGPNSQKNIFVPPHYIYLISFT